MRNERTPDADVGADLSVFGADSSDDIGDRTARQPPARPRVLVVDDEASLRRTLIRILRLEGFEITAAADGTAALACLANDEFDLVITDVAMPSMSGIELLREAQQIDRDLPVIVITGVPSMASAISSVEHSAFRYLLKPINNDELIQAVQQAVDSYRVACLRRGDRASGSLHPRPIIDFENLEENFARAMGRMFMVYQPIVHAQDGSPYGHEALLRSDELSLADPLSLLTAAERLGELSQLGRSVRRRVAAQMTDSPQLGLLFVNLHPQDLEDAELLERRSPLAALADQVVLEITERASLDEIRHLDRSIERLRELGYRLAVDDLGAGYAGLSSLAKLRPDFVKIDRSLVSGIDANSVKRRLVLSLAAGCRDLNVVVVAEGVETEAERSCLTGLGIDLLQGYLIGRPARWNQRPAGEGQATPAARPKASASPS